MTDDIDYRLTGLEEDELSMEVGELWKHVYFLMDKLDFTQEELERWKMRREELFQQQTEQRASAQPTFTFELYKGNIKDSVQVEADLPFETIDRIRAAHPDATFYLTAVERWELLDTNARHLLLKFIKRGIDLSNSAVVRQIVDEYIDETLGASTDV